MTNQAFIVSSSPHIHSNTVTKTLMRDVLTALIPALAASVILFGWNSLILVLTCAVSCVLFEYLFRRVLKRSNTISDLSAVVTGVILAFNLPVTLSPVMAMIGSFVAIVVVKQFFGGLGRNIANPAMVARIALLVSFPIQMTRFTSPLLISPDLITSATPLAQYGTAGAPSLMNLFLGVKAGCLGEVSILALLIGGLYLLARKVITYHIPLFYIGTVALCTFLGGRDPLYYIMSGGLFLGAIFMATDYVTSPITAKGKIIYGIGCGLLTYVIRTFCAGPEGVSYSIIIMNLLVPTIERFKKVRPFGDERNA